MARKEITQYYDDIDGTPLDDDQVNVVRFSLDGTDYIMDLSSENAEKFREAIAPYLRVARRHVGHRQQRRTTTTVRNNRAREIRQWALDQGKNIANRGKIPADVVEAYNLAHQ